jgi:hypothetical protein
VRILLDECLPKRLKRDLVGHDARTVPEMGWASRQNGDLLGLAQHEFDVFLTVARCSTTRYFSAVAQTGLFLTDPASGSHDREDVVTVVDGRAEIIAEVRSSPADVRTFIASEFQQLERFHGFRRRRMPVKR